METFCQSILICNAEYPYYRIALVLKLTQTDEDSSGRTMIRTGAVGLEGQWSSCGRFVSRAMTCHYLTGSLAFMFYCFKHMILFDDNMIYFHSWICLFSIFPSYNGNHRLPRWISSKIHKYGERKRVVLDGVYALGTTVGQGLVGLLGHIIM